MDSRRLHDEGFTLIELMVILVITGGLIAFSAPAIARYLRSSRVAGASNTLVADLRYGRSLANTQRRTYQIIFTANSYTLRGVSPANVITTRSMPRGVTCAASDTATFYAWGLTDPITVRVYTGRDTSAVLLGANGSVIRV